MNSTATIALAASQPENLYATKDGKRIKSIVFAGDRKYNITLDDGEVVQMAGNARVLRLTIFDEEKFVTIMHGFRSILAACQDDETRAIELAEYAYQTWKEGGQPLNNMQRVSEGVYVIYTGLRFRIFERVKFVPAGNFGAWRCDTFEDRTAPALLDKMMRHDQKALLNIIQEMKGMN